jgi:hypothetical protein
MQWAAKSLGNGTFFDTRMPVSGFATRMSPQSRDGHPFYFLVLLGPIADNPQEAVDLW